MRSYADVPSDIWSRIMHLCGPGEVAALEQTCKILRSLAAERMTWARCLQNLGPHEPPSFSPHTLPSALGVLDLRRLSIRAFQKSRLWDSPRASSSFLRVTRETVIPIHDTNPDAVLGESQTFGLELFLLPGCDHLAILWPAGYLQIWSLEHKSCHFLYPDLPEGQSEDRPKLLCCFAYDVQVDGDIHLLLIEEYLQDPEMGDRYPVVVNISPRNDYAVQKVFQGRQLNRAHGMPHLVKLRGDTIVIYQKFLGMPVGALSVLFFDGRCIELEGVNIDCFDFADEYIVCVCRLQTGDMSAVVLEVAQLSHTATLPDASGAVKSVQLADAMCGAIILEPKSFSLRKSELSVNTQHWRSESSDDPLRDRIYISVLHKDVVARNSPIVHLQLQKVYSPSGILCGPLISLIPPIPLTEQLKVGNHIIAKFRTMNAPTISGVSLAVLESTNAETSLEVDGQSLSTCSTIFSTTLTGHTLTLMLEQEPSERYLGAIKFTPGQEIKVRPLALGTEYPEMQSLTVEHYSGAVAFATHNFNSIIIKHFD